MLTIGRLASACDVNIDTIRYYERKNILQPSGRTDAGYRLYSQDSIARLNFVRGAQTLGFTLSEIAELLDLQSSNDKDCGDIQSQAAQKVIEIEDKINNLLQIKQALKALINDCPGSGAPLSECSILHYLDEPK